MVFNIEGSTALFIKPKTCSSDQAGQAGHTRSYLKAYAEESKAVSFACATFRRQTRLVRVDFRRQGSEVKFILPPLRRNVEESVAMSVFLGKEDL